MASAGNNNIIINESNFPTHTQSNEDRYVSRNIGKRTKLFSESETHGKMYQTKNDAFSVFITASICETCVFVFMYDYIFSSVLFVRMKRVRL